MKSLGHVLLILACLGVAGYALVAYGAFPLGSLVHPDMQTVFEANALGIYAHIFGASVALLLGPFQFLAGLRRARPGVHRWLGRAYLLVGVLVGGLAGLWIARTSYGGWVSNAGFGLLAVAWLFTGLRAYLSIRAGQVADHQRWMIRNFALTLAAVALRIYLPSSMALDFDFDVAYPAIAWLCWVPNLILAELFFVRHDGRSAAVPETDR